jgi:hypothetical protein
VAPKRLANCQGEKNEEMAADFAFSYQKGGIGCRTWFFCRPFVRIWMHRFLKVNVRLTQIGALFLRRLSGCFGRIIRRKGQQRMSCPGEESNKRPSEFARQTAPTTARLVAKSIIICQP